MAARLRRMLTLLGERGVMSRHSPDFIPAEPASLADENALLRASLLEAQRRIESLEGAVDADALTGLPGRSRLVEELERVTGLAERFGTPAALLIIDPKGLAAINETHGRIAGDAVLRQVARSVAKLIRTTDLLARLDGGLFGLILDHLDQDSAIETGERLARCIAAERVEIGARALAIDAAVAVTGIMAGDGVEDVLARAERNLAFVKSDD
jgi:diguanylate cyclase (GGDEF)-like protein